eukprot:1179112-Prorocentrum_minimum.AAC.2
MNANNYLLTEGASRIVQAAARWRVPDPPLTPPVGTPSDPPPPALWARSWRGWCGRQRRTL